MKIRASTLLIHPDPIIPMVHCRVEIENGEGGFSNLGLWCISLESWLVLILTLRRGCQIVCHEDLIEVETWEHPTLKS